jgi:two-component system, LuxR family, sensor kinase FixL
VKLGRNSFGSITGFASALLNRLILPHPAVTEVGMRRQAQFSSAIALFLGVILTLQISAALAAGRSGLATTLGILWAMVLMGYRLSRSKVPHWGSVLLVLAWTLFAFLLTGLGVADISTTLYGMIPVAYLLASVLLSVRWQILLVALVAVGSVALEVLHLAGNVNMNMLGGNLITLGVVLVLTSKLRSSIERRRLGQAWQINRELETTKRIAQDSEQKFRAFVEQSTDGLLLTDEQGIVIEENLAHQKLTGFKAEEIIGHPVWEMMAAMMPPEMQSPATRQRFQESVQTTLRTGQGRFVGRTQEFEIHRPDGTQAFVLQTSFLIKTGIGYRLGSISHDITERKRAEQALSESEQKFRNFIEQSTEGFTLVDENGMVIEWNQAQELISGIPRTTALNSHLWDVQFLMTIPERRFPTSLEHIKELTFELLRVGYIPPRMQNVNVEVYKQDGQRVLVQQSMFPIKKERGYHLGAVVRDITQQKRTEQEREEMIKRLEAQNAELERFNYTVSHDLKTPLVTIKGYLGYLVEDATAGNVERLKQDTQRIARAVDRMNSLLKDMLELSRIGRLMNTPETISFPDLVRDAMDNVHARLETGRITVQIQPELPTVYGDHQRLVEVLQNLLDNAAKFMGDQPNPRIEIGQQGEENGKPIFYVKDNGIGIASEHHERVFGLFYQLDPKIEGTGVGLALVKRIVEFHGGRIWIESQPGMGATFYFTLSKMQATVGGV